MGYKMIEMDIQKKADAFEHGEKAYEELGMMLECLEEMCKDSAMGQRMGYREDDEWYNRRMPQERMGYRQGVKGTGPYSRYGRRMGYRDDYRDPMYD